MKEKEILLLILALIVIVTLSGCATAVTQSMSHGDPDAEDAAKAAAFDVVTSPAQVAIGIPLIVSEGIKESKQAKVDELMVAFEDDDYRKKYIREDRIRNEQFYAMTSHPNAEIFDEEDMAYLWEAKKNEIPYGRRQKLIGHPNMPEEVLAEYYYSLKDEIESADANLGRSLRFQERLLRHPNLPREIIKEIQDIDDFRVNEILSYNPKLKSEPGEIVNASSAAGNSKKQLHD